ncbi:MAG: peptide deformylase [Parcubacteria group bacterium Gr01-1014_66]|nr:MAG: peptide deformylase [Parcubacteria group bacterium Gr01-1014_66]
MENLPQIVKIPNPVLRHTAKEVKLEDITLPAIQKLIMRMQETLRITPDGVGLAAPQIGKSLRIFIISEEAEEIDRADARERTLSEYEKRKRAEEQGQKSEKPYEERPWKYYVFINPKVKKVSKKKLSGPEGCLSVPQKYGTVERAEKIIVEAYDETAKKFTRGSSRFFARVMQHELDHLDGILFVDKVSEWIAVSQKDAQMID